MIEFSFIYRLADKFHNNKVLRYLFLDTYRKYKSRVSQYKKKSFHKNGRDVLARFCTALDKTRCMYWLEFGTLIGAIREKGFIAHDDDIDVGMFLKNRPDQLEKILKKHGFKRTRYIMVDDGKEAFEETYVSQGISIDIFYFHIAEDKNTMYCYEFITDPERMSREFIDEIGGYWTMQDIFPYKGFCDYDFLDIRVKIPSNYDEHLRSFYGNYIQPDPNWNIYKAQGSKVLKDKIGKVFVS